MKKVPGPDLAKTGPLAMKTGLWGAFLVGRLVWQTRWSRRSGLDKTRLEVDGLKTLVLSSGVSGNPCFVDSDSWKALFCRAECPPVVRFLE